MREICTSGLKRGEAVASGGPSPTRLDMLFWFSVRERRDSSKNVVAKNRFPRSQYQEREPQPIISRLDSMTGAPCPKPIAICTQGAALRGPDSAPLPLPSGV